MVTNGEKLGGIKGITYPIVADTSKTIAMNFGVLAGEYDTNENGEVFATGQMVAYRGLFLIDKKEMFATSSLTICHWVEM